MATWNSASPVQRVEIEAGETPASITACFNLTPGMVRDARVRLRWIGYVAVAVTLFFFGLGRLARPGGPPDENAALAAYASLLVLLLGGAVLALIANSERVPSFLVLRAGILYQYLGAFALQVLRNLDEIHVMANWETT